MTPPMSPPRPMSRTAIRAAAAFVTVSVLVAAWLLLVTVPGALAEERAFRTAATCAADDSHDDGHDDGCLRTVEARIDRADRVTGRKTPLYWLYVTDADGTSTRTRLTGSPQEHPVARPGARVEVTYWRGQIRYVDFESTRRYTNADPRGDYRLPCSIGLGLGFYVTVLPAGMLVAYRRSLVSARVYSWQINLVVLGSFCLTLVAAAAPWLTDSAGAALLLTGLAVPAALAVGTVAALFLRRRQKDDDTIAVTPSVPAREHVFPGTVLGDVPYAGGGGYLVAGPAHLSSTPDPAGAAFRRETPPTLTPVRVRPPYLTDPGRPDHTCLVLECEDDGVPVLVVTRRKTMPWVLGALRTPPNADPRR
ncbi:hypothetical protein [Streptomyces sp. TE33382]